MTGILIGQVSDLSKCEVLSKMTNFRNTYRILETIPNFYYQGEAPEFSSNLGMAVYVVIWRTDVEPEVFRVDMEVESKPSLRSEDFNTEFTTSELFHLLRRRPEYSTFQIHHIISACQVFSTESWYLLGV